MPARDRQLVVVVLDQGQPRGFFVRAAYREGSWAWVAEVYEEGTTGELPAAQWSEWTRAGVHGQGYARPFEAIGAASAWLAEVFDAPPAEPGGRADGGQPSTNG